MQALGGYGYIREFGIEKIKRDVKITCIYEGTSEIQQNIISTFRWKTSRKTRGAHYGDISRQMAELHARHPNIGAAMISAASHALNGVINLAHDHRLTRFQYVMFMLADIMTQVEVGAGLVKKAGYAMETGESDAEKFRLMARVFAWEAAQTAATLIARIVGQTGVLDATEVSAFFDTISFDQLSRGCGTLVSDMDRIADILFER
jgi:alkylation response protein AidB-like acyl-CoA dehydrogenase